MAALHMFSNVVPNSPEVAGEGKPRRSVLCPEKLVENYPSSKSGVVSTLYENFLEGVHRSRKSSYLIDINHS